MRRVGEIGYGLSLASNGSVDFIVGFTKTRRAVYKPNNEIAKKLKSGGMVFRKNALKQEGCREK
jgi:hypothetical protein